MKKNLSILSMSFLLLLGNFNAQSQGWTVTGNDIYNSNFNTSPQGKVGIGLIPIADGPQYYSSMLQIHGRAGNNNVPTTSPRPMVSLTSPDVTSKLDIGLTSSSVFFHSTGNIRLVGSELRIGTSYSGTNGRLIIGYNFSVPTDYSFAVASGNGVFMGKLRIGGGTINIPTGYQLAVGGKIICEELKVQLKQNWPDYVFSSEYSLPTLDSIELYINENNHLPNVPSAMQIQNEGINASEMFKIQMQKIEELTLYLIQLKKQNEELEIKYKVLEEQFKNKY